MQFLTLLAVFVGGLILFHNLERLAPVIPGHKTGPRRRGYFADLIATIVDGPVLGSFTKLLAAYIVMLMPQHHDWLDRWHWAAQFAVFFLVNDFGRYWLHRWYHESDFLWRFHRVHHTVVDMDALSTFRVHIAEGAIKYGVLILPFHVFGVDRWVTVVYSSLDILKGFWHHANLRTYIGRFNLMFNSAEQHWWHHSVEARGQRANYGSILSIWDRLFGTFYWPRGEWPDRIGVMGMDGFPDDYPRQFASMIYTDDQVQRKYGDGPGANGDKPEVDAVRSGLLPSESSSPGCREPAIARQGD